MTEILLSVWLIPTFIIMVVSGCAIVITALDSDLDATDRNDARGLLGVFFLGWTWPVALPVLFVRSVLKLVKVAR